MATINTVATNGASTLVYLFDPTKYTASPFEHEYCI